MRHKKESVIPAKAGIQATANTLLASIIHTQMIIKQQVDEYNAEIAMITTPYEKTMQTLRADLAEDEKGLMSLMKKNKGVLFDGTDVVNLSQGSLIHSKGDHVTIPKTALEACKENKFNDVIEIVESLDRDKIEKWTDAKLLLIGAERKPKEEFKYTIKE